MTAAILILLTIRIFITGEITLEFRTTKYSWSILAFSILTCLVSLLYGNKLGALISIGILMIFSWGLYFRKMVTPEAFEFLTNVILVMSVVAAFYGLVEYIGILNRFNIDRLEIIVFNTPKNRINSFFFNANYYAMMIEFFVGIAFYKILRILKEPLSFDQLKRIAQIIFVILLNLFVLYLTGCRTAWPAMIGGLTIMLFFDHHYKSCGTIATVGIGGAAFMITHPRYIPRVTNIVKYLGVRMKIWKAAIACIKDHPLFGEGPLTYMHVWKQYGGHNTQHAHNLYLDPVLSFGIVGLLTIAPYFIDSARRVIVLYKLHKNDTLVGLIFGLLVMTMIHGVLDYTVFFVQTGFLLLMMLSSFDVYQEEIDEYIAKAKA